MLRILPTGVEALRRVQEQIRESLNGDSRTWKFDMGFWAIINEDPEVTASLKDKIEPGELVPEGFCQTASCIAGTIAMNDGYRPFRYETTNRFTEDLFSSYELRKPTGENGFARDIATEVLFGIPKADVSFELTDVTGHFFTPDDYEPDWDLGIEATETPNEDNPYWEGLWAKEPVNAITAIERFINLHG